MHIHIENSSARFSVPQHSGGLPSSHEAAWARSTEQPSAPGQVALCIWRCSANLDADGNTFWRNVWCWSGSTRSTSRTTRCRCSSPERRSRPQNVNCSRESLWDVVGRRWPDFLCLVLQSFVCHQGLVCWQWLESVWASHEHGKHMEEGVVWYYELLYGFVGYTPRSLDKCYSWDQSEALSSL